MQLAFQQANSGNYLAAARGQVDRERIGYAHDRHDHQRHAEYRDQQQYRGIGQRQYDAVVVLIYVPEGAHELAAHELLYRIGADAGPVLYVVADYRIAAGRYAFSGRYQRGGLEIAHHVASVMIIILP